MVLFILLLYSRLYNYVYSLNNSHMNTSKFVLLTIYMYKETEAHG